MKPLEMIAEWRKGCSVAGPLVEPNGSPADCFECTEELVRALERRLSRPSVREALGDALRSLGLAWRSLRGVAPPEVRVSMNLQTMLMHVTGPPVPEPFHQVFGSYIGNGRVTGLIVLPTGFDAAAERLEEPDHDCSEYAVPDPGCLGDRCAICGDPI